MSITYEPTDGETPRTDEHAKPIQWSFPPEGRRVIWVKNASIRNAVVSGEFLVAEGEAPESVHAGKTIKIQVECLWYGWQPENSGMHLSLTDDCEELPNYTGRVISNIGR